MSCQKHGYTNNVFCPMCDIESIEANQTKAILRYKENLMKRECLEAAKLPDVPISQLTTKQQAMAKIAWLGDNIDYTTPQQTKRLCLEVIRLLNDSTL